MLLFLEGGAPAQSTSGSLLSMIPFLLIMVLFVYFGMIRPQKKQQKETQAMLDSLCVGDEISTNGGLIGRIVKIKDNIITLETGSNGNKIKIFKWAVRAVEIPANAPDTEESAKK